MFALCGAEGKNHKKNDGNFEITVAFLDKN